MKDILGKYARERNGRDFVYGRVGSLELYLYPKDEPSNVNETNLKRLLTELEKLEVDYHSSIEKARKELLSLSPSVSKQYKPKGQVKAEEETRRRLKTLDVDEIDYLRSDAHIRGDKSLRNELLPLEQEKIAETNPSTKFIHNITTFLTMYVTKSEKTVVDNMIKKGYVTRTAGGSIIILDVKKLVNELFENRSEMKTSHKRQSKNY